MTNKKKIDESETHYHSVWHKLDDGQWAHHFDADNAEDARLERQSIRNSGVKAKDVKVIRVHKDQADWRKPEHREAAIKKLNEDGEVEIYPLEPITSPPESAAKVKPDSSPFDTKIEGDDMGHKQVNYAYADNSVVDEEVIPAHMNVLTSNHKVMVHKPGHPFHGKQGYISHSEGQEHHVEFRRNAMKPNQPTDRIKFHAKELIKMHEQEIKEGMDEEVLMKGLEENVNPPEKTFVQNIKEKNFDTVKPVIRNALFQKIGDHISKIRSKIATESFIGENEMDMQIGDRVQINDPMLPTEMQKQGTIMKMLTNGVKKLIFVKYDDNNIKAHLDSQIKKIEKSVPVDQKKE